jgi:uncharacterized protein YeaO (DUF488 family)
MAGVPEAIQSGAGEEERADGRIEASRENARNAALLFGAKDKEHNQAVVLLNLLKNKK